MNDDEIDKLLKHGAAWLGAHPERELIVRRYLKHQKSLAREALARLVPDEAPVTLRRSLQRARVERVATLVQELSAKRVLDLGCGDGELLAELLPVRGLESLTGFDVSWRALERAKKRLRLIYGLDYTAKLAALRKRSVGPKRSLALRELALGLEALERFVRKEPLRRVHECVFGVLALESEPVDPRL